MTLSGEGCSLSSRESCCLGKEAHHLKESSFVSREALRGGKRLSSPWITLSPRQRPGREAKSLAQPRPGTQPRSAGLSRRTGAFPGAWLDSPGSVCQGGSQNAGGSKSRLRFELRLEAGKSRLTKNQSVQQAINQFTH